MNLKGKRIIYFGDSIMSRDGKPVTTAEYNTDKIGEICRGYPTLIKEKFGTVNLANHAVGGHTVKDQLPIILSADISDADIIIINVGVNDFSAGTVIGKIPDSTALMHDDTFIGNYCTALDSIYKRNPTVKTVLITPLHRNTLNRKTPGPVNTIDTVVNGNVLWDFANAIIEISKLYSCPVADMYSDSGLNRFNLPILTFEGVHPTNEGYEFIAPVLFNTLSKL